MGVTQYPSELRVRILGSSGESMPLGGYRLNSRHCELKWIRALLHVKGTPSGSEQLRLAIYSTEALSALLFASDWIDVSGLGVGGAYWIGRVRFDYDRQFMNKNSRYWLALESQSYTRNGDTFWIGCETDWNRPKYDPSTAGLARTWGNVDFFGYQDFAS